MSFRPANPFTYPSSARSKSLPPGNVFRKATSECPYGDGTITFVVFKNGTTVADGRYVKTGAEKRKALLDFETNDLILVAWPGKFTQDIFAITTKEQRDKALTVLGLKPQTVPTQTITAADGTVFIQE